MSEEEIKSQSPSAPQPLRLMPLQRWTLGTVSFAATACAILSRWLLTTEIGPSQHAMGGVIVGAVAVILPTLWLIFLSPFSPAVRLLGAAAICASTSVYMQTGEPTEQAFCNILTAAFAAIAIASAGIWVLLFASARAHWRTFGAIVAAIGLFFLFFRLEEPTGNMVPRIRPRFSKRPDQLLEKLLPKKASQGIDLSTTTANDFPRFLGADGDGRVKTGIALETDWEKFPPKPQWRKPIGAGWSAFSVVNGHAVTMEQRDTEELVTCYNAKTGELEWSHGIPARHETTLGGIGPRSTPTIFNGRVYALGATGVLRCLDGTTGALIWSQDLLKDRSVTPEIEAVNIAWGRAASPLVVDNMIVVPAGGPDPKHCVSLVAYHLETGDMLWQGGASQVAYCSPQVVTLGGVRQIVIVNESSVAGHDIASGRQLWEFPWRGSSNAAANNSQAHVLPDDRVLITKGYSTGAVVFQVRQHGEAWKINAEPVWQNGRVLKTKFNNVVLDDLGNIFGLSEGVLECVDAATGKRKWRGGRYGHGQLLLVGDVLLVLGEAGELVIGEASPKSWRELGRIQALDGKTWNNIALSGNLLLIRNGEEAACYELATRAE
jgi:outer membrane protein assembly factor BamB